MGAVAERSRGAPDPAARSPLAFVVWLFVLSVPFWVAGAIVPASGVLPMGMPVSALQFVLPLVVAAALTYRREGRGGVAALLRRTVSPGGRPVSWVVTAALVPAMLAATYGIMLLAGEPPHGSHSPLVAVPVLLVVYVVAAGCEEAGWMGYAAEPLRRRWGPLTTGLLLGVVWAVWHVVGFVQADRTALWIAGQCLSTVAIRVLMVRLFDATGGVVLTAIVVHTAVNVGQSTFPGYPEQALPAVVFGLVSAFVAAVAVGLSARRSPGRG